MDTKNNESKDNIEKDVALEEVGTTAWGSVKAFFVELFDIQTDSDRDATIAAVKKDIPFKGHTAWILIFSIFVASIGLNVSSTAVVIGAMLISPLMGPIVGIGLAIAINDVETMRRSLINLAVMVILSVVTAFLYFKLSPLTEETPELLARTYPTILDVLVAIFGGLGLMVAKAKSGTIASVIFGVAIATALMPPLCTVGYGLAIGNMQYAGGALYLFSINAVFIALSTFIISKVLRFPLVKYENSKRRKRTARIATLIAIAMMVPSVYLFIILLEEQVFENKSKEFVRTVMKYDGTEVVKSTQDFKKKKIDVYFIGRLVPQYKLDEWHAALANVNELKTANLHIYQSADQSGEMAERLTDEVKSGILEDLYMRSEKLIQNKDERIRFLEDEISFMAMRNVPFKTLSEEIHINYDGVESFSYANRVATDYKKIDTIPVFDLKWKKEIPVKTRQANNEKIYKWLKMKMKLDTLEVTGN